jgi:toxin YoeB
MLKIWQDEAWEDYLYWQTQDKKTLKRINLLIRDIDRNGYEGLGEPEPLKYEFTGWWSRRISANPANRGLDKRNIFYITPRFWGIFL